MHAELNADLIDILIDVMCIIIFEIFMFEFSIILYCVEYWVGKLESI